MRKLSEAPSGHGQSSTDLNALKQHERDALASLDVYLPKLAPGGGGSAILVGAGAVNLVTALALCREGYAVTVVDARPDPRSGADWTTFGCTFSGHDGRIFSLTEARQHHARGDVGAGGSAYDRKVEDGGWLCCPGETLSAHDRAWISDHEQVPGWLLQHYGDDIVSFNVESAALWREMRQTLPELFRPPVFLDGLIRTYPTDAALEKARAGETALGSRADPLSPGEIRRRLPALAGAVENGEIAGALSMDGFSVNMHRFGRRLIDILEGDGATFQWERPVSAIVKASDGSVRALAADGGLLRADNYVLSPGAFGTALLDGIECAGSIASVIGGWVVIPNDPPRLQLPLKISRRGFGAPGPAEGANVIPGRNRAGREVLLISSGHGFLGTRPENLSETLVDGLTEAARDTARRYFPAKYESAIANGFDTDQRHCIRPWTPTGLGVFETMPTQTGGSLIVATGHNTGGFAQSPAVARAIVATLAGREHPMQRLYHPRRFRHVHGLRGAVPSGSSAAVG